MKNNEVQWQQLWKRKAFFVLSFVTMLSFAGLPANSEPVDFEVMEKNLGADFAKGYQLEGQGKLEEAVQAYSRSINAHPENTQTYRVRAELLLELKKYKEAQADMNKYRNLIQQTSDKDDKLKLGFLALGEAKVLDGLGNSTEALRKYKLALQLDDTVEGRIALGSYYKRHGARELATKELQQVKKIMHSGGWGYNWGKTEAGVDDMLKELTSATNTKNATPGPKNVTNKSSVVPAKKSK